MKLRIVKRWSTSRCKVIYIVERQVLGFFWREVTWTFWLPEAEEIYENYIPTIIK